MKKLRIKKEPKIVYLPTSNDSSLGYWTLFSGIVTGIVIGAFTLWVILLYFGGLCYG